MQLITGSAEVKTLTPSPVAGVSKTQWPELMKLICMQLMSGSAEAMYHIHVSVEHEKYQSQLKIYAVRFRWFEGKVSMPHLSYILV